MLSEGNILYFDPFYFKNGNPAKPKFFVVLKNDGVNSIIGSLPSSKDFVPLEHTKDSGCVELPEINLNCFIISPTQIVTTNDKKFAFPTFIYSQQIDDYRLDYLKELYPNEGVDYDIWGKMKPRLFKDLIKCIKSSKSVKNKYKKAL